MDVWKGAVVRGPNVETAGIAAIAFGTLVGLYRGQFLRSAIQPTGKESQLSARPFDPVAALTEMEQLMRLRHYALRTLRSYLGWARRFLRYVGSKQPNPTSQRPAMSRPT